MNALLVHAKSVTGLFADEQEIRAIRHPKGEVVIDGIGCELPRLADSQRNQEELLWFCEANGNRPLLVWRDGCGPSWAKENSWRSVSLTHIGRVFTPATYTLFYHRNPADGIP